MTFRTVHAVSLVLLSIAFVGCATRSLPKYEPPLPRSQFMKVGTSLTSGRVRSAAADWARWPAGTKFLLLSTGQVYQVDDYGWALSGRNTIDLYCPSAMEMNQWGVRRVTIQILEWGDPWKSYRVLKPRRDYAHVRRMLGEIERFY